MENGDHEVLEVLGEAIAIDFVEVELVLACHQQIKKVLLLASLLERENAV